MGTGELRRGGEAGLPGLRAGGRGGRLYDRPRGVALSKIDEETAEQTLKDFREMGVLDEELGSEEEAFTRGRGGAAVGLSRWELRGGEALTV